MRPRTLTFAGLAILASAVLLAEEQSERPQFRTGVELLQLDVVVLDNKRQPVRGLTAADFTVLDNGVETPIRAFTPIELARPRTNEAVWAGDVAPDVVTNQVGEEDGRLVVILMDRTIPIDQPTVARKIATTAVESLGPHDLAAVVSTNNSAVQSRAVQNLTADRARLLDAINAADPSTGMSATAEGIMNQPMSPFKVDPLNDSRCLCGLCVLETITRVAEAVQRTPRRPKLLLFIGSSIIWQARRPISESFQDPGCETRLEDARGSHVRGNRPREPDRALHRSTGSRQRCAAITGLGDEPWTGFCRGIAAIRADQHAHRPREPECPSCSNGRPGRGRKEQPRADDSRDFPRERRVLRNRCRTRGVNTARRPRATSRSRSRARDSAWSRNGSMSRRRR